MPMCMDSACMRYEQLRRPMRLRTMPTLPRCRSGWGMPTLPPRGCMTAARAGLRRVRRLRWSINRLKSKNVHSPYPRNTFIPNLPQLMLYHVIRMNNVPWGEYACEGLDHRVGHPSCLSAGQKHLSTRRKGHSRTPTSCGMAKSHPPRDRSRTLLIIRLFFKINKDL